MTEQVPLTSVHEAELKDPAVPVEVKPTVPPGVLVVGGDVSVTVTVQVLASPIATGEVHETAVFVVRSETGSVAIPELFWWVPSPP